MAQLRIVTPIRPKSLTVSRGSHHENLLTADPREVWLDSTAGTPAVIDIDFGSVMVIDTVLLAHVLPPRITSSWTISAGTNGYDTMTIKPAGPLRAVDSAGHMPAMSHALWAGTKISLRYLRIRVTQASSASPLSIGNLLIGNAFTAKYNIAWGAGRKVIDTGSATSLPNGGYAIVEGVRKGSFNWTFSDLTHAEAEALYNIQRICGETAPVLVIEDPEASEGQLNRIHYGKFVSLKAFERRNVAQTRIELSIEDWGARSQQMPLRCL